MGAKRSLKEAVKNRATIYMRQFDFDVASQIAAALVKKGALETPSLSLVIRIALKDLHEKVTK